MQEIDEEVYEEYETVSVNFKKVDGVCVVDEVILSQDQIKKGVNLLWDLGNLRFEIWFPENHNVLRRNNAANRNGKAMNGRLTRCMKKSGVKSGTVFHYAIFCEESLTMCRGNSFPRMIIR
jgi:hypothetical protein